jgi:hypothetical protein
MKLGAFVSSVRRVIPSVVYAGVLSGSILAVTEPRQGVEPLFISPVRLLPRLASRPPVPAKRTRYLEVNRPVLDHWPTAASGTVWSCRFNLFEDTELLAHLSLRPAVGNRQSFSGVVEGEPGSQVVLVRYGDWATTSGAIMTGRVPLVTAALPIRMDAGWR